MTEVTTYQKRLYEFYELCHDMQDDISGTSITVASKLPHADVIAVAGHKLKRTRVYINGVRATIVSVADADPNTTIVISETIATGDEVDIFLATTTGTLNNNTTLGKIPLVKLQVMQMYDASSNVAEQEACGSEQMEETAYSADGTAAIGLLRQGNDNMENFILAKKNKVYLMIIVQDTTDPLNTTYDVLHEVRVDTYGRGTQARDAKGGEIMDPVTFIFVPDVEVTT